MAENLNDDELESPQLKDDENGGKEEAEEEEQEISDAAPAVPTVDAEKTEKLLNSVLYEKSQSLVDIANNTFKELCRTLEHEQTKLMQLEERRKQLQEEMQRLKQEIEDEKNSYRLDLTDSITDNAEIFAASGSMMSMRRATGAAEQMDIGSESLQELLENRKSTNVAFQQLDTCYEDEETKDAAYPDANMSKEEPKDEMSIEQHTQQIKQELQSVITECIIQKCHLKNDSEDSKVPYEEPHSSVQTSQQH